MMTQEYEKKDSSQTESKKQHHAGAEKKNNNGKQTGGDKKKDSGGHNNGDKNKNKKEKTNNGSTAEEPEEEMKMPGQWKSDDWSGEQDATIKKMKGENKSWKEIAIVVGASKKDIQNRWKELQWDGGGLEELGGLGGLFEEDRDGERGGSGNGGGKKDDEKEKPKQQQGGGKKKNPEKGSGGGGAAGKDKTPPITEQEEYSSSSQRQQPQGRLLVPDDVWSNNDCEVLEMLETRYRDHKWQHMQAGFFNWTGRMVVAEMIEKKFQDDGAA